MATMYLRHKKDGFIYGWNEVLAKHPLCEEVTEEEAYPERFINKKVAAKARKKKDLDQLELALDTSDIPEEPVHTSAELNAEASKGLPT